MKETYRMQGQGLVESFELRLRRRHTLRAAGEGSRPLLLGARLKGAAVLLIFRLLFHDGGAQWAFCELDELKSGVYGTSLGLP